MADKNNIENYIKGFDNTIEHLAFMRRMAEICSIWERSRYGIYAETEN